MSEEMRVISTVDGQSYEVKNSIQLGKKEFMLAENNDLSTTPFMFMLCDCDFSNSLGIDTFENAVVSDDYLEIMGVLVTRLSNQLKLLETERNEKGVPLQVLSKDDCLPDLSDKNLEGQIIIIKPEVLLPEYRLAESQLQIAVGGNGCTPNAKGQAVLCENLLTGDKKRYERCDVAGIADIKKLPEWAKQKMEEREKSENSPSLLAEGEKNGKMVAQQDRPKKAKTNSHEL